MDIFPKISDKFGVERCKDLDTKKIVKQVGKELDLEVQFVGVGSEEIDKYHIPGQGDVVMLPEELVERFKSDEVTEEELKQKLKSKCD